ncbi:S26 family signal peptidase [Methanocella arvoryzae]|uniref:Signal sequence peptidase n=1 Tax=Methanocella arvoryzae (strain DSM 22066 / NBRC 105507 / MRE50) TaxID=351160 RepID=Q0W5J6_METAR|nr:S26 family signal peptidase [Methanocella arvoryzae]CAJ36347.1 signal sequence peptidase [Methanocella arvoryzae MRE50]
MAGLRDWIKKFKEKHPEIYSFAQDLIFSLAIVALIALILYAYAGTWPPEAAVIGTSMLPNLQAGDLVLLQSIERSPVKTYEESIATDYITYNGYGDVIVYYPHGDTSRSMIIHRAIRWVNESEPMWPGGPAAPHEGYITLGDNNRGVYDQAGSVSYNDPVRKEWVHGVVKFRVPYLGYLKTLAPNL